MDKGTKERYKKIDLILKERKKKDKLPRATYNPILNVNSPMQSPTPTRQTATTSLSSFMSNIDDYVHRLNMVWGPDFDFTIINPDDRAAIELRCYNRQYDLGVIQHINYGLLIENAINSDDIILTRAEMMVRQIQNCIVERRNATFNDF